MQIKRLDITGFKSFMERVVFGFDDGVTGVVGPNGCGKSNVVDAIRWVMGEQSAKNLRGRGMEDVIFNGSETHPPLSMAEVTLTFAVGPQDTLPDTVKGMPEVSVTRRLFRSGESEYQINKTTCRLLDITELFLGTGVGTRAYSIIEQGRVGQIVSARPEDRRSFIEEAAGITKYKSRRKAAERKMESTEQNLLRVNDIVSELEKRLDSVERQAKKAEKYKKLKNEARTIELHVAAHRYLELNSQRHYVSAQLEGLSLDEQQQLESVRALESAVTTQRAALEAETLAIEVLAEETSALQRQVELEQQNVSHWNEDLASTAARKEAAALELDNLTERSQVIEREYQLQESQLAELRFGSQDDDVELRVKEEELRRTAGLLVEVEAALEKERSLWAQLTASAKENEAHLSHGQERLAELQQRQVRLDAELQTLTAEATGLENSRSEVLGRVEESRRMSAELSTRRVDEESSLTKIKEAFFENEVLVTALKEQLQEKKSRVHSLEEIARNYEGFDRGVRSIMTQAGADPRAHGIFGLLSDLIQAPVEYEVAIEAALGERLQHIVVESPARAFEWLNHLQSLAEGRSTFLPVSESQVVPTLPSIDNVNVLAMATQVVSLSSGDESVLAPLVQRALGTVAIVDTLDSARALAATYDQYTWVTLAGEVLRSDGSVTGGVMEGPAVGALTKKRELLQLNEELVQIESRYNELITRHYALQKQMGQHEGVLKGLEKHRHQEELSLASHEKDLHQAGSTLSRLRERITHLTAELEALESTVRLLSTDLQSAQGALIQTQTERDSREAQVRLLSSELDSLKHKHELLQQDTTSLKVKAASSGERREAIVRAVDSISAQRVELNERLTKLQQTLEECEARTKELATRIELVSVGREARASTCHSQIEMLETRREAHHRGLDEVRALEVELKTSRQQVDSVTHGFSAKSLEVKQLQLELQHVADQVKERFQTEIFEAVTLFHQVGTVSAEAQERVKDLRAQLERMGEVNVSAIEEHEEIRQRYAFLSKQKTDLIDSLAQLKDAIVKIDETSRKRFKETFDIVNEKFQHIFPRLFGGGRASLMLTDEGPGQEPGVEILAQPPGKKLQSVNLFSGGEKALTAVGMIFAIFLIKPTPFCLLDEVDAPLDEGNVGRYNDMVREMSKGSQFILITHNKRTMEVADTLYGVTMEEPGVSKLVSVKLKEMVAANTQAVA